MLRQWLNKYDWWGRVKWFFFGEEDTKMRGGSFKDMAEAKPNEEDVFEKARREFWEK